MARGALTFLWVIHSGWKIRFYFARKIIYIIPFDNFLSHPKRRSAMILPIFNIPSWDANGESCTIPIWGSTSVAHRFLNSHSSSRPCEFVGQVAHLWNVQKLSKIQTDHKGPMKIYENDQHASYIACFILLPLSSVFHQPFTLEAQWHDVAQEPLAWEYGDAILLTVSRGAVAWLMDLCLHGRRANGLGCMKGLTMFHKISQASIIFPFKSVISPHRTRVHESPVSGFQASAVRLCCVLASVPTPCSLGRNKSLCFSHHARGFYHTACLQILNNEYQYHVYWCSVIRAH